MKTLALAVPLALLLAACGADTKSCSTAPAAVAPTGSGSCDGLQAGATVVIQLKGTCQSCADSSPTCNPDPTNFHLDTQYQQCTEDQGCGTGCMSAQPTFSCTIRTPNASSVTVYYNTDNNIAPVNITLAPSGGSTSCTL